MFEIVREDARRVIFRPGRWQSLILAAFGVLALVGIIAIGAFLACLALIVAVPLLLIRAFTSRQSIAMRR